MIALQERSEGGICKYTGFQYPIESPKEDLDDMFRRYKVEEIFKRKKAFSPKNPTQPVVKSPSGDLQFKENAIVEYLLTKSGVSISEIKNSNFSDDDIGQFLQLVGYSTDSLRYTNTTSCIAIDVAEQVYEMGGHPIEIENEKLSLKIRELENTIREMAGAQQQAN